MVNRAIKKITEEAGNKAHLIPLEEHLTNICNEKVAEKILKEDKNLEDAFKTIRDHAKKKAQNGVAVLADDEVYGMLEKYYGITEIDKNEKLTGLIDIDINNFL